MALAKRTYQHTFVVKMPTTWVKEKGSFIDWLLIRADGINHQMVTSNVELHFTVVSSQSNRPLFFDDAHDHPFRLFVFGRAMESLTLSHGCRWAIPSSPPLLSTSCPCSPAHLLTANVKHFGAVDGLKVEAFVP